MKKKAICTDPTWVGRSDCAHCAIRNRVLFADLPRDELNVALLAVNDLVYQPDRLLYRIGEQGKVLYTVRRGMVKLVRDLADGTERVVRLLKAGDVAGTRSGHRLALQAYGHYPRLKPRSVASR